MKAISAWTRKADASGCSIIASGRLRDGLRSEPEDGVEYGAAGVQVVGGGAEAERIKFKTDEILVIANDRLLAPNTPEALAGFQPVVTAALGEIFKGVPIKLSPSSKDARERLGVLARVG
jgi:hypothetical protein